jgi:hypothetical protein
MVLAALLSATTATPLADLSHDRLAQAVVMLHHAGNGQDLGSGFLVAHEGLHFLVTAEHVVRQLEGSPTLITYGVEDDLAETTDLATWVEEGHPEWIFHGEADVATLKLASTAPTGVMRRAVGSEHLVRERLAPPRNRLLLTLGFPVGLGVQDRGRERRISPISSEAKPASGLLTLPRFDTGQDSDLFLLDKPSIEGFSGGPVFMQGGPIVTTDMFSFSEPGTWCVGIVHGTVGTASGGMAAIVPASYVAETVWKAWLRHRPFRLGGWSQSPARPVDTVGERRAHGE